VLEHIKYEKHVPPRGHVRRRALIDRPMQSFRELDRLGRRLDATHVDSGG